MLKNILGGLFAVIAGMACVSFAIKISRTYSPILEGLDPYDVEDQKRLVAAMTQETKKILVCGHMIGAFLAGFIASKIASQGKFTLGMISGMVIVIATITVVLTMRQTVGFSLILIFTTFFAVYAGARTGSRGEVIIDK